MSTWLKAIFKFVKYVCFFKRIQRVNHSFKSWYPDLKITNQGKAEHIYIILVSSETVPFDIQSFRVNAESNKNIKQKQNSSFSLVSPLH